MLKNLTNGSIQFPSADPISNKAKIIAGGLGGGLALGLGVYARQKRREQAVEKGMENFYNKHNQLPIAPPTQQTKIAELLKIASEDAENEAKLAFVYEVMEDKEIGQEVTEEVENLLADVEETLEKSAGIRESVFGSILGNAAGAAHGLSKLKPYAQAGAVGVAGIVGSALVNDLYSAARLAVTRNRNFKNMLEADPELKEHPAEKVKALFNTLHEKGGPEMSGDPLIASAFVKQQLELPPQFLLESVHKLVGTGSTLAKSKQMGSFDLSKMMRGDGQGMAKQLGAAAGKSMMNKGVSEGPRGIGGERCAVCGSNDVTVSNKAGLIFSDCEDCGHTW